MQTKFWALAAAIVAVVAAITGTLYVMQSPAGHTTGSTSGYGQLAVEVHDAPCTDCTHVWVTFQSVAVHASNATGGGWTTISASGTTVDLLALNGTALAKLIGVTTLKAGHYEQVRLTVTNVTVALGDGTRLVATIPDATSADFDGAFNVSSGGTTTLSIDVDLASSLHMVAPGVSVIFTPHIGSVQIL